VRDVNKIKYGLAAFALAGCVLTVSGCAPGNTNGAYTSATATYTQDGDCTASTDNGTSYPTSDGTGINVESHPGGNFVIGHVWVYCYPTPIQHFIDVELWYSSMIGGSGGFKMVDDQKFRNPPTNDMSNPTDYEVAGECGSGFYEVRWSVVGKDSSGIPYTYSDRWKYALIKNSDCTADIGPTAAHTEGGPVNAGE
jgi:hypothetical protein